jgi:hypothetical protein
MLVSDGRPLAVLSGELPINITVESRIQGHEVPGSNVGSHTRVVADNSTPSSVARVNWATVLVVETRAGQVPHAKKINIPPTGDQRAHAQGFVPETVTGSSRRGQAVHGIHWTESVAGAAPPAPQKLGEFGLGDCRLTGKDALPRQRVSCSDRPVLLRLSSIEVVNYLKVGSGEVIRSRV